MYFAPALSVDFVIIGVDQFKDIKTRLIHSVASPIHAIVVTPSRILSSGRGAINFKVNYCYAITPAMINPSFDRLNITITSSLVCCL